MNVYGGTIHFVGTTYSMIDFDCLWVVKTQPGFDATYMKVSRFKSNSKSHWTS